jgi:hypothetical protein
LKKALAMAGEVFISPLMTPPPLGGRSFQIPDRNGLDALAIGQDTPVRRRFGFSSLTIKYEKEKRGRLGLCGDSFGCPVERQAWLMVLEEAPWQAL